ncbi:malonate decarboxylase holo-ACP synthase [Caballeronia sp. LZ043]|uniref:malonate decarboxylase holo-ACP synthase n=1 Tax=Caballeronia sp. LZ043 TaxID=3038569 RepID=UPI00286021F2|nr:malonate decarboxylase holo-ACP synthase [Caballeronia sp. LZ043]MDR5823538.1 malonate decarboxylase holo-ACP synthase [Caballeronia sp. LZ043]
MKHAPRPHDLLRLTPDAPPFEGAPGWVAAALARAPFVVVRRAPPLGGKLAVGVRGSVRGERFGTWLDVGWIEAKFTPEDLRTCEPEPARRALPAFTLMRGIAGMLDDRALRWGPAGSAGFELASGVPAITPASDLDLILRADTPLPRDDASALFDALSQAAQRYGTRIDVQIETPEAAFSLAEYARPQLRVMLRHAAGPRLVDDPWAAS